MSTTLDAYIGLIEFVQRYDYLKIHHLSSFVVNLASMHRMHRMRGKRRCCVDAHFRVTGHFLGVFAEISHWTTSEILYF